MIEHLNIFVTINNECEERVNKLMNIVSKLQELSGQTESFMMRVFSCEIFLSRMKS